MHIKTDWTKHTVGVAAWGPGLLTALLQQYVTGKVHALQHYTGVHIHELGVSCLLVHDCTLQAPTHNVILRAV